MFFSFSISFISSYVFVTQRSSRTVTDEEDEIKKEAYLSTGNMQYYQLFCVDQLGRPLVNGDAQLTGWKIPVYPKFVYRMRKTP